MDPLMALAPLLTLILTFLICAACAKVFPEEVHHDSSSIHMGFLLLASILISMSITGELLSMLGSTYIAPTRLTVAGCVGVVIMIITIRVMKGKK